MRTTTQLFREELEGFDFCDLPKGYMFQISMNPYTGKVLATLGKNELAGEFALSIMRRIVDACMILESRGEERPLNALMAMTCEEVSEMLRREEEEKVIAVCVKEMEKAS